MTQNEETVEDIYGHDAGEGRVLVLMIFLWVLVMN